MCVAPCVMGNKVIFYDLSIVEDQKNKKKRVNLKGKENKISLQNCSITKILDSHNCRVIRNMINIYI